jgi:hypothetical protein
MFSNPKDSVLKFNLENQQTLSNIVIDNINPYNNNRIGKLIGHTNSHTQIFNSYKFNETTIIVDSISYDDNYYGVSLEKSTIGYEFIFNTLSWDELVWESMSLNEKGPILIQN